MSLEVCWTSTGCCPGAAKLESKLADSEAYYCKDLLEGGQKQAPH